MIKASGFRATLFTFGLILGGIGFVAALFLRAPATDEVRSKFELSSSVAPAVMLRSPVFRPMFAMMTMMSTGGLMVVSNFASFAKDFGSPTG